MEDMSIVFFYVDRKLSGRKRIGKKWFGGWKWSREYEYRVSIKEVDTGTGCLKVWCVGLPSLETDTRWTGSGWKKYTAGLPIPPESRFVYYAPDKNAERMLGREREPIGLEWILALVEYYSIKFDGLVLVQDREMEAEELIRHFASSVPYLGVIKTFNSDWDEIEEDLSMEYGLTIDIQESYDKLHVKGNKTLIVIGAKEDLPEEIVIKESNVLLFTGGRMDKGKRRELRRKNVTVVDMEGFLKDTVLDTIGKIKYNSTR